MFKSKFFFFSYAPVLRGYSWTKNFLVGTYRSGITSFFVYYKHELLYNEF